MTTAQRAPAFEPIAYPLAQAAAAVGVSVQHLRRAIHNGELPAKNYGRKYHVGADDLRAWFRRQPDA